MSENECNINLVETLRSKTEKDDIKQYLKAIWGGYSKDSVLEYLNMLRKQQQITADTFSHNQQSLFEEKERLSKTNEIIKMRLSQVEAEYKNLSEAMRSHELEGEVCDASDIVALKSKISVLEDDLNRNDTEKSRLAKKIEQMVNTVSELTRNLEQSTQEKLSLKEMLKAQMLESQKQRSAVLSLTGELEEKDGEIKFLTAMVSEGQLSELRGKIDDLTQQLGSQTEMMSACNQKNSAMSQELETLAGENETLRQNIARLTISLEETNCQNDKLMFVNKTLTDQLESEYKKSLAHIREKSYITTDKLAAVRKLELVNSKLTLLEFQLQKYIASEQKEEISGDALRTESVVSAVTR